MRSHRVLLAAVLLAACLSVPALAKKKKGDATITNKARPAGRASRQRTRRARSSQQ
jgi:hypothetical protein